MRVLICGDRNWTDRELIKAYLTALKGCAFDVLIEGEARGADRLSREEALKLGLQVLRFPAQWDVHGKAAGIIRNQQMLVEGKPDLVVAFHHNLSQSKGTKDMVWRAKKAGVPVVVEDGN
uniref:YspA cpYpsA-related SLOG domain-containing protein n=1 Tax=viral metagenome TaxID=1070528 RepID=A0A6M3KXP4_9ZZZZ